MFLINSATIDLDALFEYLVGQTKSDLRQMINHYEKFRGDLGKMMRKSLPVPKKLSPTTLELHLKYRIDLMDQERVDPEKVEQPKRKVLELLVDRVLQAKGGVMEDDIEIASVSIHILLLDTHRVLFFDHPPD